MAAPLNIESLVVQQRVRAFDVYVLGPLLIYAAFKSDKGLGRWTRRALFTAGAYALLYNYPQYKELAEKISKGELT